MAWHGAFFKEESNFILKLYAQYYNVNLLIQIGLQITIIPFHFFWYNENDVLSKVCRKYGSVALLLHNTSKVKCDFGT